MILNFFFLNNVFSHSKPVFNSTLEQIIYLLIYTETHTLLKGNLSILSKEQKEEWKTNKQTLFEFEAELIFVYLNEKSATPY